MAKGLTDEGVRIVEKLVVAPFVLLPILFVMFIWLLITTRRRK